VRTGKTASHSAAGGSALHSGKPPARGILLALLWIQLAVILFTIPAGRIAFDLLGQRVSFGGDAHKLFTAFLATWGLLIALSRDSRIRTGVFFAPLLALTLVALFACSTGTYGYEGLKDAAKLALCTGFYVALINLPVRQTDSATRWCLTAFIIGNLYLGLVVLFELIVGGQFRAEGTFGHPNLLAAYGLLGLPMLLLLTRLCRDWRTAVFVFAVAVLLFVSILLTFSRAAYLGLLVSGVCIWRMGGRKSLPHLIPLAFVGLLAVPFIAKPAAERFGETVLDVAAPRPESRLVIWKQAVQYAVPDLPPWGLGPADSFKDRVSYSESLRSDRPPYPPVNHAHNLLLHVWLAFGLPGLLALIWLAVRFVRFVPVRSPAGTWGRYGEHAYFFGSILGFAVFTCFDTLLFTSNVTPALVLFLGMLERVRIGPTSVGHEPATSPERVISSPNLMAVPRPTPKLRLLHLFGTYRYTGPAEMALTACSLLSKRGHELVFACPDGPPRWRISSHGVQFIRPEDREKRSLRPLLANYGLRTDETLRLNRHLNFFDNRSDIKSLQRMLREERWDVIHAHFPHELSLASLAKRRAGRGSVLVASWYKDKPPPDNPLMRNVFKEVSAVLCVSSIVRERIVRSGLMDAAHSYVLPGMINTNRFHPGLDGSRARERMGIPRDAPVAGMIARFQSYRRHDFAVEAWAKVVERLPLARLVLVGRGENEERIRDLVRRSNLEHAVIFAGYHTDDFPEYVAALDLLIYLRPGSDGTCRTVLEAMAAGRPSLVAPVGGLVDLVKDGENGTILPEESRDVLASLVLDLLSSPERLRAMGEAGRRLVEQRHTPEHLAEFLEQVYWTTMSSNRIPEHQA